MINYGAIVKGKINENIDTQNVSCFPMPKILPMQIVPTLLS